MAPAGGGQRSINASPLGAYRVTGDVDAVPACTSQCL